MIILYQQKDANWVQPASEMGKTLAWMALAYKKKVKLPHMQYADWREFSAFDRRRNAFPIGGLPWVRRKVMERGFEFQFLPLQYPRLPIASNFNLKGITYEPYQSDVLKALMLYKRGIIVASTGAGKSIIAGGIVQRLSIPKTLVITINKSIFSQFKDSFEKWFPGQVGAVGDFENRPDHITLCTFQSLNKVEEYDYKLIILDEVQRVNDTIVRWLNTYGTRAYYRFGVTATPHKAEDNFEKAIQMHGFFGPIIKRISDEETAARVIPATVYFVKYINAHPTEITYAASLRHDILYKDERNELLLKAAKKLIIDKGKTCLVLLDEIEQATRMEAIAKRMGLKPKVAHSKNAPGVNAQIKKELNGGKVRLVIATQVFGIGTDIPNVDGVVLASARKSEIDTLQKIGRGRRRTSRKDNLLLIDCIDQIRSSKKVHSHFYKYSMERMKIYEEKGWQINRLLNV